HVFLEREHRLNGRDVDNDAAFLHPTTDEALAHPDERLQVDRQDLFQQGAVQLEKVDGGVNAGVVDQSVRQRVIVKARPELLHLVPGRSEEHTSELQSREKLV